MVLSKVNLLPVSIKEIRRLNRTVEGLRLAVAGVLGVFVVLVVLLFGGWFLTNQQLQTWSVREKELLARLTELSVQEITYRRFKTIVAAAERILGERREYRGVLNDVYSRLPSGTYVEDLQFVEDMVRVRIKAADVHRFVGAVESFQAGVAASSFDRASLSSVSRTLNGSYSFELELKIKKQNG